MKSGIQRIIEERKRQIEEEGFDARRDDQYTAGELARAAASFAVNSYVIGESLWPPSWDISWYKKKLETDKTFNDRMRELDKAGALIASEQDRLLRSENPDYDPVKRINLYAAAPDMLRALRNNLITMKTARCYCSGNFVCTRCQCIKETEDIFEKIGFKP